MAGLLWLGGRVWWCTSGFGVVTLEAVGSCTSQHLLDPYTTSHFLHGLLFFWLLLLVRRWVTLPWRFVLAILLEVGWELLENSPVVIDRYRTATAALGYSGDSIVNSVSDVLACAAGFWVAERVRWTWLLVLLCVIELLMLAVYRDNLTLNVIMLLWPSPGIRAWQMQTL